jgi:multidrug efflux pump subunit AcrB
LAGEGDDCRGEIRPYTHELIRPYTPYDPPPPRTPLQNKPAMPSNISTWSVRHPVGVVALTAAVMVLGGLSLTKLNIDLLPSIIYPDIQVRVIDPGVPAEVMENEVTRELEEQLAITEGVIAIQSRTTEGRSAVDLSFRYGEDIDLALRDASSRLDRAKRVLPETDDPPIIYKRDPFQLPVAEYVVGSHMRDPVELRAWVDYTLGRSLVTLPGVAAVEVGGGLDREVQVVANQFRLAGLGLDVLDLERRLRAANQDVAAGRLRMPGGEISGRTEGRFRNVQEIIDLPLTPESGDNPMALIRIGEIAQVIDGSSEERLRIRLDDQPGIKLSIQKQPQSNTVAVVDTVDRELKRLQEQGQLPDDVRIQRVDDQARYIRHSLNNAMTAALSGALLAMTVVYIFLGSLRRTLIIGAAIPIAVLVTFILMAANGLTFNIMTLGGLALGIGMLVDSTIVMLENIYRHQRMGESSVVAADAASREVTGAIIASTSTNLGGGAALPLHRWVGRSAVSGADLHHLCGHPGLHAGRLDLGPGARGRGPGDPRGNPPPPRESPDAGAAGRLCLAIETAAAHSLAGDPGLHRRAGLGGPWLINAKQEFLPKMDEGDVRISLTGDDGIDLEQMDR